MFTQCEKIWEVALLEIYHQAMRTPEAEQWLDAMEEEYRKLFNVRAWDIVDHGEAARADCKLIPGKWVFDAKDRWQW